VPIGLFWGYKHSEDEIPDREAIDWKGNHELRQLFVNPETGVERLVRRAFSIWMLVGESLLMPFGFCWPS
jgi:hypothetical protein